MPDVISPDQPHQHGATMAIETLSTDSGDLLNTKQAARRLGMTHHTLQAWRKRGGGPRFVKFGNAVRYRPADLDQFIGESIRSNTSEASA